VPAILNRVAPSHGEVRALLRDAECLQRERFETEFADVLALVDDASSLLVKVLGMAVGRGGDVEIDVDDETGAPSEARTPRLYNSSRSGTSVSAAFGPFAPRSQSWRPATNRRHACTSASCSRSSSTRNRF
jgi:hypothetical protein